MQSWFFCIINSVFSVSRFMVCVFISLCVFVCVRDRSLRLLAVWWADQSSRRCSSWLVFLCGVVRSLSDRCCSCPVLFSVTPPCTWVWVSPGCSVSDSLSLTRAVAGAARGWCFCAVLSDRCRSCPVLFSVTPPCTWVWVSPGCSVSDSLSLTRAVAGAVRGWCFCAVLSDRCCSCPVLFSGLSLSFAGLLCLWFLEGSGLPDYQHFFWDCSLELSK